jgi:hypothetical protein
MAWTAKFKRSLRYQKEKNIKEYNFWLDAVQREPPNSIFAKKFLENLRKLEKCLNLKPAAFGQEKDGAKSSPPLPLEQRTPNLVQGEATEVVDYYDGGAEPCHFYPNAEDEVGIRPSHPPIVDSTENEKLVQSPTTFQSEAELSVGASGAKSQSSYLASPPTLPTKNDQVKNGESNIFDARPLEANSFEERSAVIIDIVSGHKQQIPLSMSDSSVPTIVVQSQLQQYLPNAILQPPSSSPKEEAVFDISRQEESILLDLGKDESILDVGIVDEFLMNEDIYRMLCKFEKTAELFDHLKKNRVVLFKHIGTKKGRQIVNLAKSMDGRLDGGGKRSSIYGEFTYY